MSGLGAKLRFRIIRLILQISNQNQSDLHSEQDLQSITILQSIVRPQDIWCISIRLETMLFTMFRNTREKAYKMIEILMSGSPLPQDSINMVIMLRKIDSSLLLDLNTKGIEGLISSKKSAKTQTFHQGKN